MKTAIATLVGRLDTIAETHAEVSDTDVREQMSAAVFHGFIVPKPGYAVPEKFGMFSPAGDTAVRAALSEFIRAAGSAGLSTPQARFTAFQDSSALSAAGNSYDEYFGSSDTLEEWSAAMSRHGEAAATPATKAWWQFWK